MPPKNNNTMSGIGTALSGLFGGIGSIFQSQANIKAVKMQNEANRQLAEYQNQWNLDMWNMQNEYNSPAAQMERFREAGLNPMIMSQSIDGGNASNAPSAAGYQYQRPTIESGLGKFFSILSGFADMATKFQNIKESKARESSALADSTYKQILGKYTQAQEDYLGVNKMLAQLNVDRGKWSWEREKWRFGAEKEMYDYNKTYADIRNQLGWERLFDARTRNAWLPDTLAVGFNKLQGEIALNNSLKALNEANANMLNYKTNFILPWTAKGEMYKAKKGYYDWQTGKYKYDNILPKLNTIYKWNSRNAEYVAKQAGLQMLRDIVDTKQYPYEARYRALNNAKKFWLGDLFNLF